MGWDKLRSRWWISWLVMGELGNRWMGDKLDGNLGAEKEACGS